MDTHHWCVWEITLQGPRLSCPRGQSSKQDRVRAVLCVFHASDSASACCTRSICHPHVSVWFIQLQECCSHATKVCISCFFPEWWYQSFLETYSPTQSDGKSRRHLHPRLHFPVLPTADRNVNILYVFLTTYAVRNQIDSSILYLSKSWTNTLYYSSNYLSLSNSLCNHNWAPSLHWNKLIYHGPITELIKRITWCWWKGNGEPYIAVVENRRGSPSRRPLNPSSKDELESSKYCAGRLSSKLASFSLKAFQEDGRMNE